MTIIYCLLCLVAIFSAYIVASMAAWIIITGADVQTAFEQAIEELCFWRN